MEIAEGFGGGTWGADGGLSNGGLQPIQLKGLRN
jgi:hypothetical protein